MRADMESSDYGFANWLIPSLNGLVLQECIFADEEAGVAICGSRTEQIVIHGSIRLSISSDAPAFFLREYERRRQREKQSEGA